MPMSNEFQDRLFPRLPGIIEKFGTPFHIYDEAGIRQTANRLHDVMAELPGFKEFFAVKALPDPAILRIMKSEGFGFDCSSELELKLARQAGASPEDIMFTSNNTTSREFGVALTDGGCIVNLDDVSFLDHPFFERGLPEQICFRLNPGDRKTGNSIIGNPIESKYGIRTDQVLDAYRTARRMGAQRFGLHTMVCSNDIKHEHHVDTALMLLGIAKDLKQYLGIKLEFINVGGGIGIPYRPGEPAFDLESFGKGVTALMKDFELKCGYSPRLFMENGRYMTGPHGVLVNRAINRKDIYKSYVGVEVAMPALMRPAMYDAHHEITVLDADGNVCTGRELETVSIVGPICENCDRLATERRLPKIKHGEVGGDMIITHDTGAHGAAMGFNYNGRTRPQGLLLKENGSVVMTRRAETVNDLMRLYEGL